MVQRLFFPVIAVFFLTMNVLLWRSELGSGHRLASPVSLDVVLEKVITSPDDSTLEIRVDGQRAGYCHWFPDPGEAGPGDGTGGQDFVPEGMVKHPRGYTVKADGQLLGEAAGARVRFNAELHLDRERKWETASVRVQARPVWVEVDADARRRTLRWAYHDGDRTVRRTLTFEELQRPEAVLNALGLGWAAPLAGGFLPGGGAGPVGLDLQWRASNDWLPLGNSRVRAYRIELDVMKGIRVVIYCNRVGEILRVDLPEGWRLINESLAAF